MADELPRPQGRARRWSPAVIEQMIDADLSNVEEAKRTWKKDAPEAMRYLLDARPPFEPERRKRAART